MRILKSYNNYTPMWGNDTNDLVTIKYNNFIDVPLTVARNQFNYEKITERVTTMYRHWYPSRGMKSFIFGNGLLLRYENEVCAVICKDGQVVICNNWYYSFPSEVTRFLKMLRENGYNTRKCIIHLEHSKINKFIFDPLCPSFEDYNTSVQRNMTYEFICSQKTEVNAEQQNQVELPEQHPQEGSEELSDSETKF